MTEITFTSRENLLAVLLAGFPQHNHDAGIDRVAAYLVATKNTPLMFLSEAVTRFLRGEVEGQNLAFCPSPAEIAREAQRLEARDAMIAKNARLRIALPKPEPEPELKISDEDRRATIARLRKKFPGFFPPEKA